MIVTKQQYAQFIVDQPADKEVDMTNSDVNDRCGCAMVQYANENLEGVVTVGVTLFIADGYEGIAELQCHYNEFVDCSNKGVKNFGNMHQKAQEYLNSLK